MPAGRLARTVVRLRPAQVAARARLRGQRIALARDLPLARRLLVPAASPGSAFGPGCRAGAAVGWPAGFRPLDAIALAADASVCGGEVSLLGQTRVVAPADGAGGTEWSAADWVQARAPLLWRFHLYYWEWAWSLAAGRQRAAFPAAWESWQAAVRPGAGAPWHPYPASVRAWSWCGVYRPLAEGTAIEAAFRAQLGLHAGFLRRHLETDVGGNHLIKNLKALAGLAVFFADDALLAWAVGRLRRQLAVQVLPDGGHYERAPAYHCQVLGDLIDVAGLLRAAGRDEPGELAGTIEAMRRWLGSVLSPDGDVPLLNDGFPVSPELVAALGPAPGPEAALVVLPDSGVARASVGRWRLLADIGPPCPRELPAHAHADTLGCLVHLDGEPLLIDTGTSTYEPGTVRDHQRSTSAHNTLEIDQTDSTEVWGAFRAGRRARVSRVSTAEADGVVKIGAAHDGYRGRPGRPVHHRRWRLSADELRVDDTVAGRGRHRIAVRWYLAPDTAVLLVPGGAVVTAKTGEFDVTVTAIRPAEVALTVERAEAAAGFGRTACVLVLTGVVQSDLPVRISTVWRLRGGRQSPEEEPA